MSFLNPVNEPVLRFKSTDAGAPQINYNARTAGDVKAVLKACLVTGYGSVASAGWSIVNEVDHVCEFVSPSVAMSDYRLGIDDSLTTATTWYYQYQDARVNPKRSAVAKVVGGINKSASKNGWCLLVSARGFYFVETFEHTATATMIDRLLYMGQVQSGIAVTSGKNMAFFSVGFAAASTNFIDVFSAGTGRDFALDSHNDLIFESVSIAPFKTLNNIFGLSTIDVASDVFLSTSASVVAKQPGMLMVSSADAPVQHGLIDNHYSVLIAWNVTNTTLPSYTRQILIKTDYWEY